jgi:hypothetical protein
MGKSCRDRGEATSFVDPDFASALEELSDRQLARGRHADHKARQLCRQVQRALSLALDGDLDELFIAEVTPASGCARLLVHVVIPGERSPADVLGKLRERAPRLRAEVARSISRKRAPELAFVLTLEKRHHG